MLLRIVAVLPGTMHWQADARPEAAAAAAAWPYGTLYSNVKVPSYFTSCPLLVGAALVLCVAEAAPDVCAGACGRLPRHHPPVDSSEPPDPSPQVGCGSRASGSATGVSKLKNMAESVRTEPVHLRQPLRTPLHARAATCPALHRCFPHACGLSACSCPLYAPCCPLRTLLCRSRAVHVLR